MALNEVKVEMLSIITHFSVQEMIDTYMVTFLPGIQTCKQKSFRHLLMHTIRNTVGFCRLKALRHKALWLKAFVEVKK